MSSSEAPAEPLTLDEVVTRLRAVKPMLRQEHGIVWMGVFGSFARGTQRRDSDIDLLVEFDPVPGLWAYSSTERALSSLLGRDVDLVMRRALKPELAPSVLAEVVEA